MHVEIVKLIKEINGFIKGTTSLNCCFYLNKLCRIIDGDIVLWGIDIVFRRRRMKKQVVG